MRFLASVVVIAAALGGQVTAAAPSAVPGQLVGRWTNAGYVLRIKPNGRVVFKLGPEVIAETATGTPTRVTFGPAGACLKKGTYSWKLTGQSLRLRPAGEPCSIRRSFLTVAWTRK